MAGIRHDRPEGALLAPDDAVYLDHFRLARVNAQLRQDRAKACTESVELLLRVPNLADLEFVA